jgi:hypothetical protein
MRTFNDQLLAAVNTALIEHPTIAGENAAFGDVQAQAAIRALEDRPLLRWFVLIKVKQELRGHGINLKGQIDWEAIAEFLKVIIPLIMEIIAIFL